MTAFFAPPPGLVDFVPAVNSNHVQVTLAGQSAPITGAEMETYLVATPNVINEVLSATLGGITIGTFAYTTGQVVGIRIRFTGSSGTLRTNWSPEKTLTFP